MAFELAYGLYVTHPQVVQDPDIPVPKWGLSPLGRQRAERFANHRLVSGLCRIVSSRETKALELAEILSAVCKAPVESGENFGENDRSSTGFVPRERFEALADAFFAHPDDSIEGWESSRDAQTRIVGAVTEALRYHDRRRPIAFIGHGAVGTLLKCHLGNRDISRAEDQSRHGDPGGGNAFVFRLSDLALLSEWTAMETLPEAIAGL